MGNGACQRRMTDGQWWLPKKDDGTCIYLIDGKCSIQWCAQGTASRRTSRTWCQAVLLKAVNAKACAADVKQFCASTEPGEGRVEACMKAHVADVSDACKVALANAAAGED
jgi:hypothetical protein